MSGDARVGVDVGGTFTDLVTVRDGRVRVAKTPSTPDAPEDAVLTALDDAEADHGLDPESVGALAHGTTVATNAVLERDWAETALVTTEGFRDALEIGRQARPDIYDLHAEKPDPVVPRDRRFEIPERLDERGGVLQSLDEAAVRDLADDLRDADAIAVSLLFAFENDAHEQHVAELLRDEGVDAALSLSSSVLPEIREYERTLATALDAALKPVMDDYLRELAAGVENQGIPADPRIMQSNGGVVAADAARERPVNTLLSGPAAGVQGATHVAGLAGHDDLVTLDMGGTSCDVSLVTDGDPSVTTDVEVGDYPVHVPSVDVHTVGAGGGSIAWLDDGGALRVGPESAGADPGPVSYGRGGTRPTVTDAHYALGRIDPSSFLGDLDASQEAVENALREHVADPLDATVGEAAQGVLDVANANMVRALRVVSVERGHDPRDFALVAFGGAGPLHAAELAADLDVPRVVVPRTAGVLSALGLLVTDVLYDYSASRVRPLAGVDPGDLAAEFDAFEERGRDRLADEGVPPDRRQFERTLDLRYEGQSFDLSVPVPDDDPADALATVADRFHDAHRRRYGHASPDEPIELVTVRLRARGVVDPPDLRPTDPGGTLDDAITDERPVVFDGDHRDTPVYDREALPTGVSFDGPALVEGGESTAVVPPGDTATVDEYGSLVVEVA